MLCLLVSWFDIPAVQVFQEGLATPVVHVYPMTLSPAQREQVIEAKDKLKDTCKLQCMMNKETYIECEFESSAFLEAPLTETCCTIIIFRNISLPCPLCIQALQTLLTSQSPPENTRKCGDQIKHQ